MRYGSADLEEVLTDEPYSLTVGQVVDGTPSIRLLRVTVRTAQRTWVLPGPGHIRKS